MYARFWRDGTGGSADGSFDIAASGLASGTNLNVTGTGLDVAMNFGSGIIEFPGSVSSLTFTPSSSTPGGVIELTFGTGPTPLIASSGGDVPTLSEWGLIVLALLLMTLGTLYLLKPSVQRRVE